MTRYNLLTFLLLLLMGYLGAQPHYFRRFEVGTGLSSFVRALYFRSCIYYDLFGYSLKTNLKGIDAILADDEGGFYVGCNLGVCPCNLPGRAIGIGRNEDIYIDAATKII
jgi:hypothetical protein